VSIAKEKEMEFVRLPVEMDEYTAQNRTADEKLRTPILLCY